jgi:hypothetical protein
MNRKKSTLVILAHLNFDYWTAESILTAKAIVRMQEVALVADLLIAMTDGIRSKKQIRKFYERYELKFEFDSKKLENEFDAIIALIASIFPEGLGETEFRRLHVFYSLFTALYHRQFGLERLPAPTAKLKKASIAQLRSALEHVQTVFGTEDLTTLSKMDQQFVEDARRATTDEKVRERRTKYLIQLMSVT